MVVERYGIECAQCASSIIDYFIELVVMEFGCHIPGFCDMVSP